MNVRAWKPVLLQVHTELGLLSEPSPAILLHPGAPSPRMGTTTTSSVITAAACIIFATATTLLYRRYHHRNSRKASPGGCPCSLLSLLQLSNRKKGKQAVGRSTQSALPVAEIQTVDMDKYVKGSPEERRRECENAAESLYRTGCLVIRDPRVKAEHNNAFLDLLEKYFGMSDGKRDARPEYHFQVGVTPAFTEQPRDHCDRVRSFPEEDRPRTICPPEADPKWRFFWRIGPKPKTSLFPELNMEPVVPPEFPEWASTMDMWGHKMLDAVNTVAAMAAEGFGLPANTFTDMMKNGPHLLAPTGSDFSRYGKLDTVLAGYHYDLNFLTIHGKSRFPGLIIWLRDGRKVQVRVPDGCLLVQAGKQMEYVTGGHVLAGFHEVIVSPQTVEVVAKRREEGKSLWRVSSTLFSHIASDQVLKPLEKFATPESLSRFPPIHAGQQVMEELKVIKLGSGFTLNGKSAPAEPSPT